MSKLKPYKVETVQDRNGSVSVDVMFDREKKDFFARYDFDNEVRAPTADACHVEASKMLAKIIGGYKWVRLIQVHISSDEDVEYQSMVEHEIERVEVKMTIRRMERAPKLGDDGGKHHVERSFAEDVHGVNQEHARKNNTDLRHLWREDTACLIPYTEESWQALKTIMQAFRDARGKVDAILKKKNLPALLAGLASRPLLIAAAPAKPCRTK